MFVSDLLGETVLALGIFALVPTDEATVQRSASATAAHPRNCGQLTWIALGDRKRVSQHSCCSAVRWPFFVSTQVLRTETCVACGGRCQTSCGGECIPRNNFNSVGFQCFCRNFVALIVLAASCSLANLSQDLLNALAAGNILLAAQTQDHRGRLAETRTFHLTTVGRCQKLGLQRQL